MKKQLCLLALPLLALSSCQENSQSSVSNAIDSQEITNHVDFSLFSTYATTKVLRNHKNDESRYFSNGDSLDIEMMQNEVEGAQLIVSASGDKSAYIEIKCSNLTSADGGLISSDNINVYIQKYITIPNSGTLNPNYDALDMVPDMLLPYGTAVKYQENRVYGGYNQGITFEVDSSKAKPGVYSSNIEIKIGDEVRNIPLNVTIWPISLEGRRTFKTSFLIYRYELLNGEYNDSKETIDSYVDYLNDYKVNSYVIQDYTDVDTYKNDILRQWDSPNFSSIIIPYDFPQTYTASSNSAKTCIAYITTLAKMSTSRDNDFIKYAYFYPSSYDEADLDPVKSSASKNLFSVGGELDKTLEIAISNLKSEGFFSSLEDQEFAKTLEEEIRNIPAIFTNVNFKEEWVGEFHATFCPYMSLFDDYMTSQKYQDAAISKSNGDLWAYSCMAPNYPYATFHIDDDNLAMRVNGWMNKKLGINGYLYYEVNKINLSNDQSVLTDPYQDPLRYESVAGDGYLLYPGRKYGLNHPIASNRLSNYRDSMDDYDLLCSFENKLNEYSSFYGTDFALDDFVYDIYNRLFRGATTLASEKDFFEARKEIAARCIELDNEDKLILEKVDNGTNFDTVVYSNKENLRIDGKDVTLAKSNKGYKYVIENDSTSSHEIISSTGRYERKANVMSYITSFRSGLDEVKTNSRSSFEYDEGSDLLKVDINSEYAKEDGKIDAATTRFTPYIDIPVSSIEDATSISFDYSNLSSEDIEFTIALNNGKTNQVLINNYCQSFSSRNLEYIDLSNLSSSSRKSAKYLRLYFSNVKYGSDGSASLYPTRSLSISNFSITKEGK